MDLWLALYRAYGPVDPWWITSVNLSQSVGLPMKKLRQMQENNLRHLVSLKCVSLTPSENMQVRIQHYGEGHWV